MKIILISKEITIENIKIYYKFITHLYNYVAVTWKFTLLPEHGKNKTKQKQTHFAFRFSGYLPETNFF